MFRSLSECKYVVLYSKKTLGDTTWLIHDRFGIGMFIHFGLYAMPVRHEWVKPEFTASNGTCLSQSDDSKRLYVHLLSYPFSQLTMDNLADKIQYAQFLYDASQIAYQVDTEPLAAAVGSYSDKVFDDPQRVRFKLPVVKPNSLVPVIGVFLK